MNSRDTTQQKRSPLNTNSCSIIATIVITVSLILFHISLIDQGYIRPISTAYEA